MTKIYALLQSQKDAQILRGSTFSFISALKQFLELRKLKGRKQIGSSENIFGKIDKNSMVKNRDWKVEEEREMVERDRRGKIKLRYFIHIRFKPPTFDPSLHIYR